MKYNYRFIYLTNAITCIATPKEIDTKFEKLKRMVCFYYDLVGIERNGRLIANSKKISNPYIEYVGVARLKKGDKNNMLLAHKIAKKKATRQAIKGFKNAYQGMLNQMHYINQELRNSIMSSDKKIAKITKEIEDL